MGARNPRIDMAMSPMLMTKHGRIFAAMPRSASQTSPRLAAGTAGLLGIVAAEQFSRQFVQGEFWQITGSSGAAQNLGRHFLLLGRWQHVDRLQHFTRDG